MRSRVHLPAMVAVAGLLASSCAAGANPSAQPPPRFEGRTCVSLEDLSAIPVANAPELDRVFPWFRPDPVVRDGFDFDAVRSGGPPPDGIEPIDAPCFDDAVAVDWLQPNSPVLFVEVGDDRRAYPLAIMTQHEIVNDVVGGVPVVVTYCPLCNSGIAFERTVGGDVLDFGTSGMLFQSNLVMYDRQTKTLWTQFTGRAVVGEDHVGADLARLPTSLLSWEEFLEAAPDGLVLSRESMPGRDYGRNPYPGYEGTGDQFLFDGPRDPQLPPNDRVIGLGTDIEPIAVTLEHLQATAVVDLVVAGSPVTLWWAPGQSSALDASSVDDGRDVGSTAAFRPVAPDGRPLTFTPDPSDPTRFRDAGTGSVWNLLGEAIEGELKGTRLEAVAHDDTFWFVWFAFQPSTAVIGASGDN